MGYKIKKSAVQGGSRLRSVACLQACSCPCNFCSSRLAAPAHDANPCRTAHAVGAVQVAVQGLGLIHRQHIHLCAGVGVHAAKRQGRVCM